MLKTRRADVHDAALITAHRRAMFDAMGRGPASALDVMSRTFEAWVAPRLADGRYLGWITSDSDRPVASAGMLLMDWPPVPHNPLGTTRGYLLNVYVDPDYRRRGLAQALLKMCMAEARQSGIRVLSLHASDEGRPLYERLGFAPANEMLYIAPETS